MSKYIFLFYILIVPFTFLNGQKGWEAGAWLGTSFYFGDLNTRLDFTDPGLAGGLNGRYNFNTRICAKGSLSYAKVYASDEGSPNNFERNRNLSFKSNIIDFTTTIEFNFFEYVHGSEDYFFTPYLMTGFSIFRFNPQAELNGVTYNLADFDTELVDYGTVSGGLTIGGGYKWDINRKWSINIEASYRKLFTDYLDDVSSVYPNSAQLSNATAMALSDRSIVPDLGLPGRQRGNSKDNDSYVFFGVSLMRYFGRLECPKISNPG